MQSWFIKKHSAILSRIFVCLTVFMVTQDNLYAQIDFKIEKGMKPAYAIGDTVVLLVKVKVNPKTCTDGMSRTKNFLSGLKITEKGNWQETIKGVWLNRYRLVTESNKKGMGQFTISRRTDKDNLVKSIQFQFVPMGNH